MRCQGSMLAYECLPGMPAAHTRSGAAAVDTISCAASSHNCLTRLAVGHVASSYTQADTTLSATQILRMALPLFPAALAATVASVRIYVL